MIRLAILLGAGNAALAIILGAFAAHGLKNTLSERMLTVFETGVQYHFYHALGLIIVGILIHQVGNGKLLHYAMLLMVIGIILFSGSLYALSLSGIKWLGMITPLGGISFIVSWILIFLAYLKA